MPSFCSWGTLRAMLTGAGEGGALGGAVGLGAWADTHRRVRRGAAGCRPGCRGPASSFRCWAGGLMGGSLTCWRAESSGLAPAARPDRRLVRGGGGGGDSHSAPVSQVADGRPGRRAVRRLVVGAMILARRP